MNMYSSILVATGMVIGLGLVMVGVGSMLLAYVANERLTLERDEADRRRREGGL